MKSRIYITTALFCTALFVRADVEVTMAQLRNIGFLPQDKAELKPEDKLDLKRRNPFAERKKASANKPADTAETEDSKLRAYFDKLKVSGFSDIGGKLIVTMGRHNLEAGQVLPQLIPGQTQILRVMRVEKNLLEIGWVEEQNYDIVTPRKITKKIDLKPYVGELLPSEDNNTGETAQMYFKDDQGKVVMAPKNMIPNPSEIMENIPPGSDTNPDSALSSAEQEDLNAVDAAHNPPPSPAPARDAVPNAVPSGESPAPAPAESPEDRVQPEPDMVPPPAEGDSKPAGPPAK